MLDAKVGIDKHLENLKRSRSVGRSVGRADIVLIGVTRDLRSQLLLGHPTPARSSLLDPLSLTVIRRCNFCFSFLCSPTGQRVPNRMDLTAAGHGLGPNLGLPWMLVRARPVWTQTVTREGRRCLGGGEGDGYRRCMFCL